jgi:hypothetical protein
MTKLSINKNNKLFLYNLVLAGLIVCGAVFLIKKLNTCPVGAPIDKELAAFEQFQESQPAGNQASAPVPPLEQKAPACKPCGSENSRRNEEIMGGETNKDLDVIFGSQVPLTSGRSFQNNQENVPDIPGGESLFALKYASCKPECCEPGKSTGYSCSSGCVCKTPELNNIIASRGDGVYPYTLDSDLRFKPYEQILSN